MNRVTVRYMPIANPRVITVLISRETIETSRHGDWIPRKKASRDEMLATIKKTRMMSKGLEREFENSLGKVTKTTNPNRG
jgi:hypothetical protein